MKLFLLVIQSIIVYFWNCNNIPYTFSFDPSYVDSSGYRKFSLSFDSSVSYSTGQFSQVSQKYTFGDHVYPYRLRYENGGYVSTIRTLTNFRFNSVAYATNLLSDPLIFTSSISLDRTERGGQSHLWLNITLDSNIPVEHDIIALGGVLYDDGTFRGLVNADYVDGKSLQGGTHWEWKYDMNGFTGWAYRKHLGLNCFYGFVSVEGNAGGTHMTSVAYANEKLLDLPPPDFGPFADVQELPDYEDYKPTPTTYPTLPEITFNFTPNNNYTTYNYDTVNNYDSTVTAHLFCPPKVIVFCHAGTRSVKA